MHFEVRFNFFSIAFFYFSQWIHLVTEQHRWLKSTKLRNGREAILNRSYWSSLRSDNTVVSMGVHEDVFVKEDGEWRCNRVRSHTAEKTDH